MKLYYKLALINSFTRILIVAGFLVFLPGIIYDAAIKHIDSRLEKKEAKMLHLIHSKTMGEFIAEATDSTRADSAYSDYTVFKENFVSIEPIKEGEEEGDTIITSPRNIDSVILNHVYCATSSTTITHPT
jgi:hypothetical protein